LSKPVNAILEKSYGSVVIVDNDTVASSTHKAKLSVRDISIDENAGTASFTVLLDKATTDSFSVAYTTADGSANAGSDYIASNGILNFAAGETVKVIKVTINDDNLAEFDELFSLNLGAITGNAASSVALADATGHAIIAKSDQPVVSKPYIQVSDVTASENDGYMDFVVSLSAPSNSPVSVYFNTVEDTAIPAINNVGDYGFISGTLNFAPGVTSQTVRVAINDDNSTLAEAIENFYLKLSNPVNALLSKEFGLGTIVDNDATASTAFKAKLTVANISVDEKAGTATFVMVLDRAPTDSFNVNYATSNGTATAGSDYTAVSGTMTFGEGETVKNITVSISDDLIKDPGEVFYLNLSGISGAAASQVQITTTKATATINEASYVLSPSTDLSNDTVTLNLTTSGVPISAQLAYQITGVSSNSVKQALDGIMLVDGSGNSSITLNLIDNLSSSSTLNFAVGNTSSSLFLGNSAADTLTGSANADILLGRGGNDILQGGAGNDVLDGGAGQDIAMFSAKLSNYKISRVEGVTTVQAKTGTDGTDTLTNVESLKFSDLSVNLEIQALAASTDDASVVRLMELYVAFFNRAPDADGLAYWMGNLKAGQSLNQIADSFYNAGIQYSNITGLVQP